MQTAVAVVAETGQSCQEGGCNVGRGMLSLSTYQTYCCYMQAWYAVHTYVECSLLMCTPVYHTSVCIRPACHERIEVLVVGVS